MKSSTKQLLIILAVLFTMFLTFACTENSINPEFDLKDPVLNDNNKVKAQESFSYIVDLTNQTSFSLEGINGLVNIKSVSNSNQVTISGEKIVSSDSYEDSYSHLDDISTEIVELANELMVRTVQPQPYNGRSYTVIYTISVPSHMNLDVKCVNGKIVGTVSLPVGGTVDLILANGNIDLNIPQNTSADLYANLVNGTITHKDLNLLNGVSNSKSLKGRLGTGQGSITLKTTNGNIEVAVF